MLSEMFGEGTEVIRHITKSTQTLQYLIPSWWYLIVSWMSWVTLKVWCARLWLCVVGGWGGGMVPPICSEGVYLWLHLVLACLVLSRPEISLDYQNSLRYGAMLSNPLPLPACSDATILFLSHFLYLERSWLSLIRLCWIFWSLSNSVLFTWAFTMCALCELPPTLRFRDPTEGSRGGFAICVGILKEAL